MISSKESGMQMLMGVDIGPGGFNRSKVLGIIDLGGTGQAVMRRSRGFEVVDRFRRVLFTAVTMREVMKGMTKNLRPRISCQNLLPPKRRIARRYGVKIETF